MEKFSQPKQGMKKKLEALRQLIADGAKLGFDVSSNLEKVNRVIDTLQDKELRIVLLGSFSDGKTSAIAGLLGHLETDMKIDNDESSDELRIYHPLGMKGVKVIDTPGLFGTKEKEVDGKNVKFSEITERYISEAHIIIYVCAAVVPLKESHAEIIRKVMRTYHKLDNTIFVINKMDEAGYDLTDEEDFNYGRDIKKQNLIKRLRDTINLTPDEERRLNIVCIAADPKGKGLAHWFTKMQDYYKRSHIQDLKAMIDRVSGSSDVSKLKNEAVDTSVQDVLSFISDNLESSNARVKNALKKVERQLPEMKEDQKQLKSELTLSRNELRDMINNIKNDVIRDINGASLETIGDIIETDLGTQNGNVTFYVFQDKINSQIEQCCESNARAIESASVKLKNMCSLQETLLTDAVAFGSKQLKNVTITGEQVKMLRDIFAKNFKFKPWGAINLGAKLTKAAGIASIVLSGALQLYSWRKKHKEEQQLQELKTQLIGAVNDSVQQLFSSFQDDSAYYKNFAPSYIKLCEQVKERDQEIEQMRKTLSEFETYKQRIDKWRNSAEYVEFEEINKV